MRKQLTEKINEYSNNAHYLATIPEAISYLKEQDVIELISIK